MSNRLAVVLTGPTGAGKSEAALALSHAMGNTPILSMDSMQLYRGMDIGTAKLPLEERQSVEHCLIDVAEPDQVLTVSDYRAMALEKMTEVWECGRCPLLCGGTGLYLDALRYEMHLGEAKDEAVRERLKLQAETEEGRKALYSALQQADPESAQKLHENDVRRVIRALEIYSVTGKRKSDLDREARREGPFHLLIYGLTLPREALYERLNHRTERMLEAGWIREAEGLMDKGIHFDRDGGAAQAIGYPEIEQYLKGKLSYTDMKELIQRNTRRYAKRQWTWLRHETGIKWFDEADYPSIQARTDALIAQVLQDIKKETGRTDA